MRPLLDDRKRAKLDQWLKARHHVDPDFRTTIEKQIRMLYERVTASSKLPLLSLPTKKVAGGKMSLGRTEYAGPKHTFGVNESDLLRHTAIFGQSGSGKTNTVLHLIKQVAFRGRGIPVLFFDWKRTGRRLIQTNPSGHHNIYTAGRDIAPFPFNPFIPPPGVEPHVHAQQTVDLLAEAYTLGDGARSLLQRAIAAQLEDDPSQCTPAHLIRRVQDLADHPRSRQWAVTAERILGELAFIRAASSSSADQAAFIKRLSNGITFLELDALSLPGRSFLATALTAWLYRSRLAGTTRDRLDLLIVFEEAHHLLHQRESSRSSQLETLLRLIRETGIGAVLVDQTPSRISGVALANTFTTICLNTKHPADVQRASSVLGLAQDERDVLLELPVGCGVVRIADRWNRPFMVQTPAVELAESSLTDEQLLRLQGQIPESSNISAGPPGSWEHRRTVPGVSQGPRADSALSDRGLALIADVLTYPDDGVKRRYQRLGLSVGAGHRLKCRLIKSEHLEQAAIPVLGFEHTRKVVLGLTKKTRHELGASDASNDEIEGQPSQGYASVTHHYWQRWWARHLTSLGYTTDIEAPRSKNESDGRFDVLARRRDRSVAVEIETGKSNVEANIRRGLKEWVHLIVVVATDEAAMSKLETRLASSGLLIPGRVELVLRDHIPDGL